MKRSTKLVLSAVFAAIICVGTSFTAIPLSASGFFNLGDSFIFVAALTLGPLWGGIAAAIGAAVSDLILGFAFYAPATFVIKWLMAVAAFYTFKLLSKTQCKNRVVFSFFAAFLAEIIMVLGYFVFECFVYSFATAVADIIGNAIQGGCSIIAGTIIFNVLKKTGIIKSFSLL